MKILMKDNLSPIKTGETRLFNVTIAWEDHDIFLNFNEMKSVIQRLSDNQVRTLSRIHFHNENDERSKKQLEIIERIATFEFGVRQNWWEDFDEKGPIPFPKKFKLSNFPNDATTANLVVALGIFPSITQARKNNVNGPLTIGLHSFKKGKIRAIIE